MTKREKIEPLVLEAMDAELENTDILLRYTVAELGEIFNGIGPDAFPVWLRGLVTALHPSLEASALIHDVEWHESDFSRDGFKASNDRFKRNGYRLAKHRFAWYSPRRYIVMNQARRFGNLCQKLGWSGWATPCACAVCKGGNGDA